MRASGFRVMPLAPSIVRRLTLDPEYGGGRTYRSVAGQPAPILAFVRRRSGVQFPPAAWRSRTLLLRSCSGEADLRSNTPSPVALTIAEQRLCFDPATFPQQLGLMPSNSGPEVAYHNAREVKGRTALSGSQSLLLFPLELGKPQSHGIRTSARRKEVMVE